MAKYRKLGRTSSQRKALIRNQVTALLNNGKIVTTEAKAKEIRKTAEGLIALAVKEKDNFDEVTVMAKVAILIFPPNLSVIIRMRRLQNRASHVCRYCL